MVKKSGNKEAFNSLVKAVDVKQTTAIFLNFYQLPWFIQNEYNTIIPIDQDKSMVFDFS